MAAMETTYGVFLHSSGVQGGWVVRTVYDGWVPAPYKIGDCVHEYKREHAAQALADRMNAGMVEV